MIVIEPYKASWPIEFARVGSDLRALLGDLALRIDHIGSTAVPNLVAKDVIDIQVTVAELAPQTLELLKGGGYVHCDWITQDHVPPCEPDDIDLWGKWVFKEPENSRRVNLHVRVEGRPNQRYPILCRDYLRAHPQLAAAYGQVKQALARLHPEDADAYYDVKDPVFDIIMGGAEDWVTYTNWQPGPSDS